MLIWESTINKIIEAPALDAGVYSLVSRVVRHETESYNSITGENSPFNLQVNLDYHVYVQLFLDGLLIMASGVFVDSTELSFLMAFLSDATDYDLRDLVVALTGNWAINLATEDRPFSIDPP